MCSMFSSEPVSRLSTQMTRSPLSSRYSQRCEPRNPAPPVTTDVFTPYSQCLGDGFRTPLVRVIRGLQRDSFRVLCRWHLTAAPRAATLRGWRFHFEPRPGSSCALIWGGRDGTE